MPFTRRDFLNCFVCNVSQSAPLMTRIQDDAIREIAISRRRQMQMPFLDISDATRLCFACRTSIVNEIEQMDSDPHCLRLNVVTQSQSNTCFICNRTQNIKKLTQKSRINVFIDYDIYIQDYIKCCVQHINEEGDLIDEVIPTIRFLNRPIRLSGSETKAFFDGLRSKTINSKFNGNTNRFSNEDFKYLTSIEKNQFDDLFSFCNLGVVGNINKKYLLTFLLKIKHDLPDELLKVIFDYPTRQYVSSVITKVRESLMRRFVPENIGMSAISREQFIMNHVTSFSNALYNPEPNVPRAIVYIDGSYTYVCKSTNFQALRQSYSVHKNRHLVKPQMIVAPDGYILDVQGPYFSDSRNNDAKMLLNEFENNTTELREWFQEGDIVILDRGYRDALPLLVGLGLTAKMPPLLQRGERQLNTEDANEARIITKTRWIVETRNGHMKSIFKFLDGTVIMPHVLNLRDFYKIAGAMINRYHGPVLMQGADTQFAEDILERSRTVNEVQARVEAQNLTARRANWVPLTRNDASDFPQLTEQYLRDITIGTYHIKLAPSYVQDKMQREDDTSFKMDSLTDEAGFLRVALYSRYRGAAKYQLWIAYETEMDRSVLGYYCTCKAGARTVGTCAHVASVLWFLGYARYVENVWYPDTAFLERVLDAGHRPVHPRDPNNAL